MKRMFGLMVAVAALVVQQTAAWADAEVGKGSVVKETVEAQVPFTYKTESKTLQVGVRYTIVAEQNPNTLYDHTTLQIPFDELSEALGVTVTTANMVDMTYLPLTDGTYDHNNDNWYDKQGFRSSWGGQSWWFIQPITTDVQHYTLWTGQAGLYNAAYTSRIGDTYHSMFYVVSGEKGVEIDLTLKVVGSDEEAPEWVHVAKTESMQNVRDLGGWTTERGETVLYGKLLRGCEMQGEKMTATAADLALLHDELGVRADLDLRTHQQALNIKTSPLGADVDYLRVVNEPFYLDGVRTAWANLRSDFDFILKNLREGRTVYFHCIWGADRTGTLALMLEGLLGLSEDDLYQDYELTALSFPEGETRTKAKVEPIVTYVKTFDGETQQQKFINYWHQHAHVSLADLNEFCQIMLGTTTDYTAGMPEAMDNLAYDASFVEASFTHNTTDLYSVNDGILGFGELPEAKHWNTWSMNRPAEQWLRYGWSTPQKVERVRVAFWSDNTVAGDNVLVPASWTIQYWDEENCTWKDVVLLDGEAYTQSRAEVSNVRFQPVTTTGLRLVMQCQKGATTYSAVGVTEWEVMGHRTEGTITIGDYPIQNVDFSHVHLNDLFWTPRMVQNQTVTIPVALDQCEKSNRMLNFEKAAAILRGENIGYFDTECTFDDTDIYKILEGMAYSIQTNYSAELDARMDELIALVASAQEPDGYLYTPRTAGNPAGMHGWVGQNRWEKDPDLSHELYNAGHLYEAAVAHFISTGKTSLLDVARKNADLLVHDFLYGGLTYEPGHQIVEMGLMKMYRATGNEDYLRLAKYFLDLRGTRGIMRQEYSQTHKPVVMQDEAVGHAVRAVYMYSGMADVAALMHDDAYLQAIDRIWENVTQKKYYITGGIGARHNGEAFGSNYELPNQSAYCETCAAIGNVYWNWRMFLLHGEAKYYDVIERTLYNGVISGIQIDGKKFFYPNPLASDGTYKRSEWFGCACCPSNLCRFMASIPGYIYAHKDAKVYVNLYAQGVADIDLGEQGKLQLTQTTEYPWKGDISLTLNVENLTDKHLALMLRLPGWATGQPVPSDLYHYTDASTTPVTLYVNGTETEYALTDGYMTVEREWEQGDVVTFSLPMDVRRVEANTLVKDDEGRVAIERGPIVYCMEEVDNPTFSDIYLSADATLTPLWTDNLNGLLTLSNETATLIPYYAWCNRQLGRMQVWVPADEEHLPFEAWPVRVSIDDLEVVGTTDLCIETEPLDDDWDTHSVAAQPVGADIPTELQTPISQFSLDMMYMPVDDVTLCRTKTASDYKGFWLERTENSAGPLYNQVGSWNESTARIFLNVEGFYRTDQTVVLAFGQRPNACQAGVYTTSLYMLSPRQVRGQKPRAWRFDLRIHVAGDVPDAIENVNSEQQKVNTGNAIYDLQGRRVVAPVKGLYIVGNKKILVK